MLLYLQIQMTIISWRTHPPPSHAVGEENSSPRSPCRLPVILPRISTGSREWKGFWPSQLLCVRDWSGQATAIPGFDPARGEGQEWCAPTLPVPLSDIPASTPGKWSRVWLQAGTDPALPLGDFHSTLTLTHWARTILRAVSVPLMTLSILEGWFQPIFQPLFPAHWKFKHSSTI